MKTLTRVVTAEAVMVVFAAVAFAACGGGNEQAERSAGADEAAVPDDDASSLAVRLDHLDLAVADWENATSLADAHRAAEHALNLVVGPEGPSYGDLDGDGVVAGESGVGLLPGLDGELDGLATLAPDNDCIVRDVLGGGWTDANARWQEMLDAIDAWRPDNNTMPTLASHPMRVVGWATFTLATDDLDDALEFAGHARLHVGVSQRALDC